MKNFIAGLFITSLFTIAFASFDGANPGQPAPDFKLKAHDGKEYKLSQFKGKNIVLEWYNKDCPFVRKHYDSNNMQKLQEKAKSDDVVWLSIVSSAEGKQGHLTPEQASEIHKSKKNKSTLILLDESGKVGRLYGAQTTPHMFVIDKKGIVAFAGAIDSIASTDSNDIASAENYVSLSLEALKDQSSPKKKYAKPYGCSVKY